MPQRQNITRHKSVDIQGEDSWVEISRLTVGEARQVNKEGGLDMDAALPFYAKHIHNWNWVDDDGEPLPLPGDDESVIDQLTDLEFAFIAERLAGSESERKKS